MTTLTPHRVLHPSRLVRVSWCAALAAACSLAFVASPAQAQQAPPSSPAPPPPAAQTVAPLVLVPPSSPPPPAPSAVRIPAAQRTPTAAVIRPAGSASALPPDSVRARAAAAQVAPPVDAVAQCSDGTFIVAPGDSTGCTSHKGLRVRLPQRAAPPVKASAASAAVSAAAAKVIAPAKVAIAPPANSTMQCKDGTFLYGTPSADRCTSNGGVAVIFPRPAPAPQAPTKRP